MTATFSEDRRYRYSLERDWQNPLTTLGGGLTVCFIGLNPSTADETRDDPTVRRCVRFARDMGAGSLLLGNLFAYRATSPEDMKLACDPVGPENDDWLLFLAKRADITVAAWGSHGGFQQRSSHVLSLMRTNRVNLWALGLCQNGEPRHPLYLKKDARRFLLGGLDA